MLSWITRSQRRATPLREKLPSIVVRDDAPSSVLSATATTTTTRAMASLTRARPAVSGDLLRVLMLMVLAASCALVSGQEEEAPDRFGGFEAARAATEAADADVRARALEVQRLVLDAQAAGEAAKNEREAAAEQTTNSGHPNSFVSGVGRLGDLDEGMMYGQSNVVGDTYYDAQVADPRSKFPHANPTPMIDVEEVVWDTCAKEGELCECGYQGSGGESRPGDAHRRVAVNHPFFFLASRGPSGNVRQDEMKSPRTALGIVSVDLALGQIAMR